MVRRESADSTPRRTPPSSQGSSRSASSVAPTARELPFELPASIIAESVSRADQLEELERLLAEVMADTGSTTGDMPCARLGGCIRLLRAEVADRKMEGLRRRRSHEEVDETPSRRPENGPTFVETLGNLVAGCPILRCEVPSGPRQSQGMQPCCGRGEWQSGENNGILSFTFKILKSKLKDGGRMRLGIVAQDANSGEMDYALWFNPYNGYFSEAAYDVPEVEAGKLGDMVMSGSLARGKAEGAYIDCQADTIKNELRFAITDAQGYRHPWSIAHFRKKPVPLPAVFAPFVRMGKQGDAVELVSLEHYLPGGVIKEQLSKPPLGVLVADLERALSMPDPSVPDVDLAAARVKLANAREVQQLADRGTSCPFVWLDADALRDSVEEMPVLMPFQALLIEHPEWLHTEVITLEDACRRTHAHDHCAISHRWDERETPDPSGVQLEAIRTFLIERQHIKRVWIDYCCMPQASEATHERTEEERQLFSLMLKNCNLLFLGVGVLILTDRSYLSRFWCSFEAWLAMQDVSKHGLVSARSSSRTQRCSIVTMHGAPEALIESLVEEWSNCTAAKAFEKLSSADVAVTNQSDKDTQLPKIIELDERTVRTRGAVETPPSPLGRPQDWPLSLSKHEPAAVGACRWSPKHLPCVPPSGNGRRRWPFRWA